MRRPLLTLGSLLVAGLCSTLLLWLLGESPKILFETVQLTLGTGFGLGYTLYYATPFIFTGLSVALCFHCGLFNIGAEGQLAFGAIAIAVIAHLFPTDSLLLGSLLGFFAAGLAGGVWGGLAGWLKAKRGSHEVIVTILLNFIAQYLVSYLILYPYKDLGSQNPETFVLPRGYHLPTLESLGLSLFATTPVNMALFFALIITVLIHWLLFKTSVGFELRAVGESPGTSRTYGISTAKNVVLAFFVGGFLSGLVGLNDVMGYHHRVIEGFSPGYGFTGIAVALVAGNRPLGIIFSGLLFGALQNGARELEFSSEIIPKELVLVLQGILIACLAGVRLLEHFGKERKPA